MRVSKIKDLKRHDLFRLSFGESPIWVRGEYDRGTKSYSCYKFDDVNHERFFKGSKSVFVDFDDV